MNDVLILIFQIIVLIFSVIIHEVSHGAMAYKLGDDTAKKMGRLTLNPFKHLDFFGSFLLPLSLIAIGSRVVFGWAKPVIYNPSNLKNPKKDAALIGLAGPASTIVVAVIFSVIIRIIAPFLNLESMDTAGFSIIVFLNIVVSINLLLAIFNLIPIPPLDGSKILYGLLPDRFYKTQAFLEKYGMFILIFLLFFGGLEFVGYLTDWLHILLTGKWTIF